MIWAIIRLQKEGFHYWKDALDSVSFLRNRHRHLFHITVFIQQKPAIDREVEYILTKHWLIANIPDIDGPESCETIATNIKERVEQYFTKLRKVKVEVSEDGENGALVE